MPSGVYKHKPHSEETKRKISEHHKKHGIRPSKAATAKSSRMLGKKHSEETKMKMSIAHTGRKVSPQTRIKMSEANKGETCHFWRGGIQG